MDRAQILASLMMSHSVVGERSLEEASQDLLTGLGNRRSYFQALDSRVEAGDQPAVLYIDIDGFKDVNDRLGRLAGDSALRVIARRLSSVVRPTDELPASEETSSPSSAPATSPSLRSSPSPPG